MDQFITSDGSKYDILFGYGILKQLESSLFKFLSDETIKEIQDKWGAAQKNGKENIEMTEGEIWNFLTPIDFRSIVLGNVDYGLEMMAKMIRVFNGSSIGDSYEERYDFVLGMPPDHGRQIAEHMSNQVAKFQQGSLEQGKLNPSTATQGAVKVLKTPLVQ